MRLVVVVAHRLVVGRIVAVVDKYCRSVEVDNIGSGPIVFHRCFSLLTQANDFFCSIISNPLDL